MNFSKIDDFDLIENFLLKNFSSPTHWPAWNLIISRYYNTNFYYLGSYDENKLIGICPIHEYKEHLKTKSVTGQVHYNPYGGWIHSKEVQIDITKIPIKVNQLFRGYSLPLISEFNTSYTILNINDCQTLLIDLKQSYDDIFTKSFHRDVRTDIRKAIKNNLIIKKNDDIDKFYHYFKESCKIRSMHIPPKSFFIELFEIKKNIKFQLYWAMHNNAEVGYAVTACDKDFSVGLFSYMIDSSSYGQGAFLISGIVKDAQLFGCSFFDMCYIQKKRMPTIYNFKKKFSKYEVPINYINVSSLPYKIAKKIKQCI